MNHSGRDQNDVRSQKNSLDVMGNNSLGRSRHRSDRSEPHSVSYGESESHRPARRPSSESSRTASRPRQYDDSRSAGRHPADSRSSQRHAAESRSAQRRPADSGRSARRHAEDPRSSQRHAEAPRSTQRHTEDPRSARRHAADARSTQRRPSSENSHAASRPRRIEEPRAAKPPAKKNKKNVFGVILVILQGLLSVSFLVFLKILDILPMKYYIPAAVLLVLLFVFVLITQGKKRKKKLSIAGKIISVLLCLALGAGNYYLIITNHALNKVTGDTAGSYVYMDVAVLKEDPAKKIQDAADYTFGTQAIFQPKDLSTALLEIEEDIGKHPKTKDYASAMEQADALFAKEVGAIIYNRDFQKTMAEKYPDFEQDVRIIKTITIEKKSDIKSGSTVDVTKEPFLIYISGNDEMGPVSAEGRTDVNMLVAVNPNTHQVLMINTPRDFFVELPGVSEGKRDKLTHSGIYGIQCQIDTMNALYGYDIDFYFKINFQSLIEIVDALGGIDFYNDYEFAFSYSDTVFEKGNIHLDGWKALEYCRERKNLESGDEDRGRHQQIVIEAIMNKLLSSSGISAYNQMLATLEKCCITNMPKESISALVKKQLDEGGSWTVTKAGSQGEGMVQVTYSMGDIGLFVVMPYAESIQNVQQMLAELYTGNTITVRQLDPETDKVTLVAEPKDVEEEIANSGGGGDEGEGEEGGEESYDEEEG